MTTVFTYLRSAIYFVAVPTFTIFYTLFSISFVWFLPYDMRFKYLTLWSRTVIFLAKVICGIRYNVTGFENIPKDRPYVLMVKHQSQWECFFLLNLLQPITFVSKTEVKKLSLGVGQGIQLLEPIIIDRRKPKESLRILLKEGSNTILERKLPIMIFPEGTRSKPGKKSRYARSAAQLAIQTGAPVIFATHNAGNCWPDRGFLWKAGTVEVKFSDLVEMTDQAFTPASLTDMAEDWIESNLP